MRRILTALALLAAFPPFALAAKAASSEGKASIRPTAPPPRLQNAAPSIDALIERFLTALEKKDEAALRHLRINEAEYRQIILPGSVPPGTPRRHYREDVTEYFWGTMNGKSAGYEKYLIDEVGGRGYTKVKSVSYHKGETRYAGYTAYKQLRLVVEDAAGEEHEIRTGSIADLDGQYKFISFIRD